MPRNQIRQPIDPMFIELHNHYVRGSPSQPPVTANGSRIRPSHLPGLLPMLLQDGVAILDAVPGIIETGPGWTRNGEFIDGMIILEEALIDISSGRQGNLQQPPEEMILAHLKTRAYIVGVDQESQICTICQMEYEGEESTATTRCGHEYHTDCIRKWLAVKNRCPLCNSKVVPIG